jgi:hypothetical protein
MSVAVGIAAGASAMSASNSAQIARIKREECELIVETYDPVGAPVIEMKEYAQCVNYLHPNPASDEVVFAGKIVVLILLLAFVLGLIVGIFKPDRYHDWVDRLFIKPLCYTGCAFVIMIVVALIVVGISFLLL